MTRGKNNTYKIYRLIDLQYSPGHSSYVRYVGLTTQELEDRLKNHTNRSRRLRCAAKSMRVPWFDFSRLSIQLLESVTGQRSEAGSRERLWVELHQIAGYDLLNITLMNRKIFPEGSIEPAYARKFINLKIGELTQAEGAIMED